MGDFLCFSDSMSVGRCGSQHMKESHVAISCFNNIANTFGHVQKDVEYNINAKIPPKNISPELLSFL